MRIPNPFRRAERRADYSDAIVDAIVRHAGGSAAKVTTVAAVEAAAGAVSRAFASAKITPRAGTGAVTPSVLAAVGRDLITSGQAVFLIGDDLSLRQASSWDVEGRGAESEWRYTLTLSSPSGDMRVARDSESVLDFRYAVDARNPHRGISPLSAAAQSSELAAYLETRLSEEVSAAVGRLLPAPLDRMAAEDLDNLKSDLATLKGKSALVPSMAAGWGDGRVSAPAREWESNRLGANPPEALVSLRNDAAIAILGACGVPPSIVLHGGDGTAQREGWRRFLHGTLMPLGEIVAAELRRKFELDDLAISFAELFASDLSGRARAFQSMVGGGMDLERAAALAGLLTQD